MTTRAKQQRVCARQATVVRCDHICDEHVEIELRLTGFPASQPGQFLQIQCHTAEDDTSATPVKTWTEGRFPELGDAALVQREPYLRRPFSIADHWRDDAGDDHLVVISRAIGLGTRWLDALRAGDTVDITGPLGHGFEIPPPGSPLVLIGGGVGIPPLLYLARELQAAGHTDVAVILGVRAGNLLPVRLDETPPTGWEVSNCVAYPGGARFGTLLATDDGSLGGRGFVTDALQAWNRKQGGLPPETLVCACGPEPMLWAVAQMTRTLGLRCQLCIERNMGCGLGTCLSCVVRARDAAHPAGWRWQLACSDGPVFERDRLLDYDAPADA